MLGMGFVPRTAGTCGELLVLADLIAKGHVALRAMEGLPFDLVLIVGKLALKIQVKAVTKLRSDRNSYRFCLTRGNKAAYSHNCCDLFACIELESRQIAYFLQRKQKAIQIKKEDFGKYDLASALKRLSKNRY